MKPRPHAELIKAWADGAEIEYFSESCGEWSPCAGTPLFIEETRYRIKPQPKQDVKKIYKVGICNFEPLPFAELGAPYPTDTVRLALTFDGETGKLKHAEVVK